MKTLYLLPFLLLGCSPKVFNPEAYKIAVVHNKRLLENKETLIGRTVAIRLTMTTAGDEVLHPRIYLYGTARVIARVPEPQKESYILAIKPNTNYLFVFTFRNPGEAVIMLIWENGHQHTPPFVINLRYYAYNE